jgi:hypothetical protein
MSSTSARLAVGLLHHRPFAGQSERSQYRIELALLAASHGYALVEVFQTGGNGLREDVAFQELEIVGHQVDAAAVIWAGEVDAERVGEVAWRLRMVVVPELRQPGVEHGPTHGVIVRDEGRRQDASRRMRLAASLPSGPDWTGG